MEGQLDAVHLEQLDVLLDNGILRFGQNGTKRVPVERIQISQHRQTADNLRNQSERLQILRCDILHHVVFVDSSRLAGSIVSYDMGVETLGDLLLDAIECTTTNEKDVFRVYGNHLLVGVLASSLRRNIDHRTFKQFEQSLLHPFTADIAGNGRVVSFTGNLVYFVDKDNALLCFGYIVIGHLKQTGQNAFDIFAYIPCLCQHGCIHYCKWNMQQLGDGTCQKCFTGSGAAHHDNVRLLDFHIIATVFLQQAFIVVIHRYGKKAFGIVLANHILVEEILYFYRFG